MTAFPTQSPVISLAVYSPFSCALSIFKISIYHCTSSLKLKTIMSRYWRHSWSKTTFQRRSRSLWAHHREYKWDNWHCRRGGYGIYMWEFTVQRSWSNSPWLTHLGHAARVFSTCDGNLTEAVQDAVTSVLGLPSSIIQYRAYFTWSQWQLTDICCIVRRSWRVGNREGPLRLMRRPNFGTSSPVCTLHSRKSVATRGNKLSIRRETHWSRILIHFEFRMGEE